MNKENASKLWKIIQEVYRIAGDKRDVFKDLNKRKTRELLNDILSF